MKWDGVRALAFIEDGRLRLVSQDRQGHQRARTRSWPGSAGGGRPRQVLLDGEIVAFTDGRPDFEALQPRMHVSSADAALRLSSSIPVTLPGVRRAATGGRPADCRCRTSTRRETLNTIISNGPRWLAPPNFPGPDLDAVRAASVANGLEGVVVKRLDSVYEPGARPGSWLKVKNQLRQEVVVAGWKPGQGNRAGLVGSLLVGVHSEPGALLYAGHVGTGFSDPVLRMLTRRLDALRRPGLAVRRPGAGRVCEARSMGRAPASDRGDVRPVDEGGSHAGPRLPGAA